MPARAHDDAPAAPPPPGPVASASEPAVGGGGEVGPARAATGGVGCSTVVHGYTLHETLGTGTFGRVRRATKDREEYAIKIVSRQQLAATAMTPQLKREVAIQKSLVHPNIVQLRQVLRSPNKLYMVLELAAEGELYWAIQRHGPLSLSAARRALFQLSDALLYCHERGVVHRDVKPENVLFDAAHNIKLSDFGLSSSSDPLHAHAYGGLDHLPDPRLLRTACGSPHYCAPEVRSPGPRGVYDGPKADAWSVGVVLFLMVNGYLPFHDDDPHVLQTLVETQTVVYPDSMPHHPRDVCQHLLVRDPSRRWSLHSVLSHAWVAEDASLARAVPPPITPVVFGKPRAGDAASASSAALGKSTPSSHKMRINVSASTLPDLPATSPSTPIGRSLRSPLKAASSRIGGSGAPLGRTPDGWYTFGRHRSPAASHNAPGPLPREAVPDLPDDASFSDPDSEDHGPAVLKPRRKSLLSVRSRSRGNIARDETDDDLAASFSKRSRRDSSLRPKKAGPRRGLTSFLSSSREGAAPPASPRHSGHAENGDDDHPPRRTKRLFSRRLFSVPGLPGRKFNAPVPA